MAERTCPHCGAKLFPHEVSNGECSGCGRRLPADITTAGPAGPGPGRRDAPAPEADWPPRSDPGANPFLRRDVPDFYGRFDRPSGAGYGMVRVGINMTRWGLGLLLLMGLCGGGTVVLFAANAGVRGGGGVFEMVRPLAMLLGVAEVGLLLVVFLGVCFCCTVPGSSQGVVWARGLIVFLVLVVMFGIAAFVVNFAIMDRPFRPWIRDESMPLMLFVLGGLLLSAFGQQLCFLMTLRGVARDFGDYHLGGSFLAYFITSIVIPLVGALGVFFVMAVMMDTGPQLRQSGVNVLPPLLSCGTAVAAVGMFIWLMTLLGRLYNLIPLETGGRYGYGGRW
ncbi:MAG TPA: hypothetical protein VMS17_22005 [Gemmataceae bacterium]|nr:hypothetical protein [Gemmataceae bacterium]